jgi:hypothetical protein
VARMSVNEIRGTSSPHFAGAHAGYMLHFGVLNDELTNS